MEARVPVTAVCQRIPSPLGTMQSTIINGRGRGTAAVGSQSAGPGAPTLPHAHDRAIDPLSRRLSKTSEVTRVHEMCSECTDH